MYLNNQIRVATVFSGIGSFEWALKRLDIPYNIIFACDNGDLVLRDIDYKSEIKNIKKAKTIHEMKSIENNLYSRIKKTNFVERSYLANYEILDDNFHYDVRLLDGKKYKGCVDIFVGGSPCQSFSIMGKQMGLEDTRGTLFYEYARLVKEIQPKVFIYENVQGLLKHDKGKTWETIKLVFDSLGYYYSYRVLNSKDYGIPQNRNRLFVVGFKKKKYKKLFEFPSPVPLKFSLQDFLIESCDKGHFSYKNYKSCPGKIDEKYFISDKVKFHVLSPGTKSYVSIPKTDLVIARPLLATMHKMHRAAVDNYVTVNGKLRRLSPTECSRLMGFGDDFKQVVSDTQMYRQFGNSIVSDIFVYLFPQIQNTGVFK